LAYIGVTNLPLDLKEIMIMCEVDSTIVTEKCQGQGFNQMLPLHFLVQYRTLTSGVTDKADCFRYLLNLYPAAAGIKDGTDRSPYDWALVKNADLYFIRLLLNADLTIDPERRCDLNYVARKEAMFLAYGALTKSQEPSI
jgi:hypothetical protein